MRVMRHRAYTPQATHAWKTYRAPYPKNTLTLANNSAMVVISANAQNFPKCGETGTFQAIALSPKHGPGIILLGSLGICDPRASFLVNVSEYRLGRYEVDKLMEGGLRKQEGMRAISFELERAILTIFLACLY